LRVSDEEERVETRKDALLVIRDNRNGVRGQQIVPSAVTADVDQDLAELARAVDRDLSTPDLAPATERAYAHDWADFAAFCGRHGLEALPAAPQTLALYLKSLETARSRAPSAYRRQPPAERIYIGPIGLALPTLRRRLAAIAVRHTAAGHETPTDHPLVRRMLRRYARTRGTAAKKKEPLTIERLPAIVAAMSDDLPALRDRALILLGYAGAFRRSELVALDVGDLRFTRKGLYVWIAGAKNDPRRAGRELYVPRLLAECAELCAAAGLEQWLDVVGKDGPVFRTFDLRGRLTANRLDPSDVARVLRRRAAAAGVAGDFAGHSLRRGFITNAAKKKIPIENIKRVTGQRSSGIVLDYVAAATLDDDPPLLDIVSVGA
jgi:integrase